jgi:hypothetical protein
MGELNALGSQQSWKRGIQQDGQLASLLSGLNFTISNSAKEMFTV